MFFRLAVDTLLMGRELPLEVVRGHLPRQVAAADHGRIAGGQRQLVHRQPADLGRIPMVGVDQGADDRGPEARGTQLGFVAGAWSAAGDEEFFAACNPTTSVIN